MTSPFQPVAHYRLCVFKSQIPCIWWVPCKNNHVLQLLFFRQIQWNRALGFGTNGCHTRCKM